MKVKVFRSLLQELEDEAIADFDKNGDQFVYDSKFLLSLSSDERQSPQYATWWMMFFGYVFGYAQAKGWTSVEKRMALHNEIP
jgi:hypothetical protein